MMGKYIEPVETSAQLIDSMRNGYAREHEKALDECPFSEQAIAYAFEELAPVAQRTIEEHIEHCRACMDLILDTRTAEIESQEQAKHPPKVLPALSDAISQPSPSSLIAKIVGGTFMTLRIIAAPVAVVCFMLIISRLDVLDNVNVTNKSKPITVRSQPVATKTSPAPAARQKQTGLAGDTSQDDAFAVSSFSIHEGWSLDPFEPVTGDKPRLAVKKKTKPSSPLKALDPSQLKLVGVMLSDKGNKALVEDASGKGYVVREGTTVGINTARVSQIIKDRVIIEEEIEDAHGKIVIQKRVIKLNKP
jgi:hypothetical protein